MAFPMDGIAIFLCVMLWLASGGWAFRRIITQTKGLGKEDLPGLLGFCLVLAPFAFGMVLCKALDDGDAP